MKRKGHASPHLSAASASDEALLGWLKDAVSLKAALDERTVVVVADPLGRVTSVNDRFCSLTGYARVELVGQELGTICSDHHPEDSFCDRWRGMATKAVWHGELTIRTKEGSHSCLMTTVVPTLNKDDHPWQYVVLCFEVTEQKRISEQLQGKLRLQGLLADLSMRFVRTGSGQLDEAIKTTQQQVVETLGLDRSTLWQYDDMRSGMVLTHYWQMAGWPTIPERFSMKEHLPWADARIRSGEGFHFSSTDDLPTEAAKDAGSFRVLGSKSNVTVPLLENGQVFGALSFSTLHHQRQWTEDVLAELRLVAHIIGNAVSRQRSEERAEELRRELAHAMRLTSLGGIAEGLAHELNQPLAAILTNAQAAKRFIASGGIEPDELRDILDDIVRADKRAGGVIHHLRAMVSKRPVQRELCSLNDIVSEVVELLHGELLGEEISVHLALVPYLPQVKVARVEVQQVLVNLFLNAMHAMKNTAPSNRAIHANTTVEGGTVLMRVQDRGHGISPERLPSIFEPFFSTKMDGLGMGLSISRTIVESHSGRIEARNHDGGGAVFSVYLPAAQAG